MKIKYTYFLFILGLTKSMDLFNRINISNFIKRDDKDEIDYLIISSGLLSSILLFLFLTLFTYAFSNIFSLLMMLFLIITILYLTQLVVEKKTTYN